jgi:hypothetical protein
VVVVDYAKRRWVYLKIYDWLLVVEPISAAVAKHAVQLVNAIRGALGPVVRRREVREDLGHAFADAAVGFGVSRGLSQPEAERFASDLIDAMRRGGFPKSPVRPTRWRRLKRAVANVKDTDAKAYVEFQPRCYRYIRNGLSYKSMAEWKDVVGGESDPIVRSLIEQTRSNLASRPTAALIRLSDGVRAVERMQARGRALAFAIPTGAALAASLTLLNFGPINDHLSGSAGEVTAAAATAASVGLGLVVVRRADRTSRLHLQNFHQYLPPVAEKLVGPSVAIPPAGEPMADALHEQCSKVAEEINMRATAEESRLNFNAYSPTSEDLAQLRTAVTQAAGMADELPRSYREVLNLFLEFQAAHNRWNIRADDTYNRGELGAELPTESIQKYATTMNRFVVLVQLTEALLLKTSLEEDNRDDSYLEGRDQGPVRRTEPLSAAG